MTTIAHPANARFRVVCDLDAAEYELQQQLAANNPGRHPPLLEMISEHGGHRFNEGHIGRVADADAAIEEPTNAAQDAVETAVSQWTIQQKLQFMQDAAQHWLPPAGDELSHWYGSNVEAKALLDRYPEIRELLGNDTDDEDPSPQGQARRALEIMQEMENHPYDSADWQNRWESVRTSLGKIAGQS